MGVFGGVGEKYFPGRSLISAVKAGIEGTAVLAAVKRVGEDSVVPPGLESLFPLFPALKGWAKLGRPSGAGLSSSSFYPVPEKRVLAHTLKGWARLGRPSAAGFIEFIVLPGTRKASSRAHTEGLG